MAWHEKKVTIFIDHQSHISMVISFRCHQNTCALVFFRMKKCWIFIKSLKFTNWLCLKKMHTNSISYSKLNVINKYELFMQMNGKFCICVATLCKIQMREKFIFSKSHENIANLGNTPNLQQIFAQKKKNFVFFLHSSCAKYHNNIQCSIISVFFSIVFGGGERNESGRRYCCPLICAVMQLTML